MMQQELFPGAKLAAPISQPRTVPEAIAAGFEQPHAENPFLFSSTLWEAFNIGQYLQHRGLKIDGFRKSRGSSYINSDGVVLRYRYFAGGWYVEANR